MPGILFQFQHCPESGFRRRRVFIHFMPVKRISHLKPQRIARSEPGGLHLVERKKPAPHFHCFPGMEIKFISELAGITGTAQENIYAVDFHICKMIVCRKCILRYAETAQNLCGKRSLQIEFRRHIGFICKGAFLRQTLRQFRKIDRAPRGIHHNEKFIIGNTVDNQVVNHAALFVQQKIVTAGTGLLVRDTACQSRIQSNVTPLPLHPEFTHVADIEQRHRLAGMFMFRKNPVGILHRHIPSGKRHHFCFQGDMFRRKRRFQQNFFRHTHLTILNYSCVKSRGSTFRHSMTTSLAMALSSRKHAASPNLTWFRMP